MFSVQLAVVVVACHLYFHCQIPVGCSKDFGVPRITLFAGIFSGKSVTLTKDHAPNLAKLDFDNKAHSVCFTGPWLLYEHPEFNTGKKGFMEYLHGPRNACINLGREMSESISSVRRAGHEENYTHDSLTTYEEEYFQGVEEVFFNDLPFVVVQNHKSLITTGQANWTIYVEPKYKGHSFCIVTMLPEESDPDLGKRNRWIPHPRFITNVVHSGFAHGVGIKSLKKGCHSKELIFL